MEQIYLNTTEKLYLKVYVGGTLTSADGAVSVVVKDSEGTTLRTVTASAEAPGVYYIYTLLAETANEQTLTYTWSFSINSEVATKVDTVQVVTPYVSIGDIKALNADATYEEIKYAEAFARLNIDAYTGQNFGKRVSQVNMHGNDQNVLVLPHRIIRIDEVLVDDTLVWAADPPYNEFGKNLDITDTNYGIHATVSEFSATFDEGYYSLGNTWRKNRKYTVNGLYGWETPPEEVSYAGKLLVDDYFCKETAWKKRFVEQINASDWRVVFNQKQFQGTGNFYADKILDRYRSIGMVLI